MYCNANILDDNWGSIIEKGHFALVKEAVSQLMNEIRPNAVAYVDAFDVPDRLLQSSIGLYSGNVYEELVKHARMSKMNQKEPFDGYEKVLKPHLDREFLKQGNKIAKL